MSFSRAAFGSFLLLSVSGVSVAQTCLDEWKECTKNKGGCCKGLTCNPISEWYAQCVVQSSKTTGTSPTASPDNNANNKVTDNSEATNDSNGATIALAVVIPVVALVLLIGGFLFWRRRRQRAVSNGKEDSFTAVDTPPMADFSAGDRPLAAVNVVAHSEPELSQVQPFLKASEASGDKDSATESSAASSPSVDTTANGAVPIAGTAVGLSTLQLSHQNSSAPPAPEDASMSADRHEPSAVVTSNTSYAAPTESSLISDYLPLGVQIVPAPESRVSRSYGQQASIYGNYAFRPSSPKDAASRSSLTMTGSSTRISAGFGVARSSHAQRVPSKATIRDSTGNIIAPQNVGFASGAPRVREVSQELANNRTNTMVQDYTAPQGSDTFLSFDPDDSNTSQATSHSYVSDNGVASETDNSMASLDVDAVRMQKERDDEDERVSFEL